MKQKKGAIELSMTTIIVIVLGVTLLVLGLAFVQSTFKRIRGIADEAFTAADKTIQEQMGSSDRFYISGLVFEIEPGEKTDIYIGIQNFDQDAEFQITAEPGENENVADWFIFPGKDTVRAGQRKGFPVVLKVPKTKAPGSSATFVVKALRNGVSYDSQAIVVTVQE